MWSHVDNLRLKISFRPGKEIESLRISSIFITLYFTVCLSHILHVLTY